jgi:IS30 family transposase
MEKYHRLSPFERERIFRGIQKGDSYRTMAKELCRSPSTIAREISRNLYRYKIPEHGYSVFAAQYFSQLRASSRRQDKGKLESNPKLFKLVVSKLKQRWSPEQISRYLSDQYSEDSAMQLSHESIYTYIYVRSKGELRTELAKALRQSRPERRAKGSSKRNPRIVDMISIEERPKEVEDRTVPGHWEGDLIIGKGQKSALGTIVERTTRFTILVPLKGRDAETVRKAFSREIKQLPKQVRKSMTYDQGSEMAQHRLFTKNTEMKVYFAHPHSPWERGTNENTNMLVRDFFPKGTDFHEISRYRIKKVQQLLNTRPRKVIEWKFPGDVFAKILQDSG